MASAKSAQALRGFIEASAIHTLIRQRPPTPSCRGLSPYCGENSEPDRYSMESLTSNPELENSLDPERTFDLSRQTPKPDAARTAGIDSRHCPAYHLNMCHLCAGRPMAEQIERRLTAILSADVVGYARLMAADDEGKQTSRSERSSTRNRRAHRSSQLQGSSGDSGWDADQPRKS